MPGLMQSMLVTATLLTNSCNSLFGVLFLYLNRLVLPALILFLSYFSVVATIAIVLVKDTLIECFGEYRNGETEAVFY